jgi:hypothetical protein
MVFLTNDMKLLPLNNRRNIVGRFKELFFNWLIINCIVALVRLLAYTSIDTKF